MLKVDLMSILQDETSIIWISSGGERSLKLASVSRIIPGQRTVRFLRPYFMFLIHFSTIFDSL